MSHPEERRAICLLSGGLDSATALAIARKEGFACYCLSFDYGQRHRVEIAAATRVADQLGAREHRTVQFDLRMFGGSALTSDIAVPKDRDEGQISAGIPITYVPARNTIFLSFALAYAEITGAGSIFMGVNAIDYSGYPDCRPEYIKAYQDLANLATKYGVEEGGIKIHTPIIYLSKAETIKLGHDLGVDYAMTVSCYRANQHGEACGTCDSCMLRKKGFSDANVPDVTRYAAFTI